MRTVQMTLDDVLVQEIDQVVKELGTTRSAFAREAFRAAIRAKPDSPAAHRGLGGVLLAQGLHEAAEAAYRAALRLCRELGRPVDQELRILGSLLTRYMRFQGTVGDRPSDEAIQQLRADGRTLVSGASDERAIAVGARVLVAAAILSFS